MSTPRALDVGLAAAAFVVLGGFGFALTDKAPLSLLLTLLLCAPLVFRKSLPVTSAVIIYAVSLFQAVALALPLPANLLVLAALYSVTAHGPRWASMLGFVGGGIGAVMFASFLDQEHGAGFIIFFLPTALAVIIAWALGLARRSWLAKRKAEEQSKRVELESRTRDAELAVAAERARIAREMHDVVAHSLSVIIAQADGGRYAAKADPQIGVQALDTISEIGREALSDIRRILGVLRSDDGDGPLVQPQPTDQDIATLVERVRQTGVPVAYSSIGHPRPLLPGMGLTIQRVCQEALTNAMKHAGPKASISVLMRWTDDDVVLQIDDDGRGAASVGDGKGTGILGMRERAQLFGGQLTAGPRLTGGYRVQLTLPLPTKKEAS